MKISIIGGGGWGLSLAKLLAENEHQILVWEYNPEFLQSLRTLRTNPVLLPNITLPNEISFTDSFSEVAAFDSELILLATPCQFIRHTLKSIKKSNCEELWLSPRLKAIVNVAKGIEEYTLLTIDKILEEELPEAVYQKICALSGPSHAEEVARGLPTTVVIAGSDEKLLIWLQDVFSNEYFRVYRSFDILGVEIGGAVKNIIAIAAGIISGLGFGDNTMGALLTRGIVEISRLGAKLQAKPETFLGLSGIGDLITTAISTHSRNRFVGYQIGQGKTLSEIQASMQMVAEGITTTNSVYHLALKNEVDMPIVTQVYEILYRQKDPLLAMRELMLRELKAE